MVLAVLVIPIALGAKAEFQIRAVLFRPSANSAFVFGDTAGLLGLSAINLLSVYLPGGDRAVIAGR